jgi:hypothetical protein
MSNLLGEVTCSQGTYNGCGWGRRRRQPWMRSADGLKRTRTSVENRTATRHHEYQRPNLRQHVTGSGDSQVQPGGDFRDVYAEGVGDVRDDQGFHVIYTLPTAGFAAILAKTRVNPVIHDSPYLREASNGTDSIEVKQFGNSFLYLKGAASTNAPISTPTDMLIHDEVRL